MNRLEWHGDDARRHVRSVVVAGLYKAAQVVERRARELLNVAGTGGGRGKKLAYGANPSKPGEPPRKQTGRLLASVAYDVDEAALTARVGTNVEYGKHLELGTKRGLAPRPWLRRALDESAARVNSYFGGG